MKIRTLQLNPTVGEIDANVELILNSYRQAEKDQIDLLILPELVLTGYPPQDLLESEEFRRRCFAANRHLEQATGRTVLVFGTITKSRNGEGIPIANSALVSQNGARIGRADKTLLPVYDIFDEKRYFAENRVFGCVEIEGVPFGITVCEDIWHNENETGESVYDVDPAAELKKRGARAIINISASPYTKEKYENRGKVLSRQAARLNLPLFYSNQVGGQAEILFDGDAQVIGPDGNRIGLSGAFEVDFLDVSWDEPTGRFVLDEASGQSVGEGNERLFKAICTGIRDYLKKSGVTDQVLLGLSGGIDSALVAVLAVEALGAENVRALSMPSRYSSEGSVLDAERLAANLGIQLDELPVESLYRSALDTLSPLFKGTETGVAEENLQSRIRGMLLMACSNKFGPMLLTTGNKSELAVGYATLYGDMNGALNPIGDLYKMEVYALSRWLNESHYGREVIPEEILEKPPSAELRPDQRDQDTLPPYEILDAILYRYLEHRQEADRIAEETGYEMDLVKRILRMTDLNEFKRFQAPPVLKLSSKSFGMGRRWPLVQGWSRLRSRDGVG